MPTLASLWRKPPDTLHPAKGLVDLWRFRRDLPADEIRRLTDLLDASERDRAVRLVDKALSGQFIAGHGRLRQILARYLGQRPARLEFIYGTYGKPQLTGSAAGQISFNLAHSGAWGLLAVTASSPLGVDIERVDADFSWQGVAARYFPAPEHRHVLKMSPARRRRGFYRCWVRREAVMKMTGSGFAGVPDEPGQTGCHVRLVPVAKGYVGAVAALEEITVMRRFDFACQR